MNFLFFLSTVGGAMGAVATTRDEWEYVVRPMEHFCELLGWKNFPHIDERRDGIVLVEDSDGLQHLSESVAHWRPKLRPSSKKISLSGDDESSFDIIWDTWFSNSNECDTIIFRYTEEIDMGENGIVFLCTSLKNPTFEKLRAIYDRSILENSADEESFVLVQLYSYMYTIMFEDDFIGRIETSAVAFGLSKWEVTASAFEHFVSILPQSPFATLDEIAQIHTFIEANPSSGIVALFFAGLQQNAKIIDLVLQQPHGAIHAGNIMKEPFCTGTDVSKLVELATSIIDVQVGHVDFPNAIALITQMAPYLGYVDAE